MTDPFLRVPSPQDRFHDSPLLVYTHPTNDRRDDLVVLIHGLGGSGRKTWRHFAPALYGQTALQADLAIFDYRSGLRRRPFNSPDLDLVADLLMDELKAQPYERIHLVGHSMGGVLALAAIRFSFYNQKVGARVVDRVASMTMIASPRAGSKPVLIEGTKDARYIGSHSHVARDNNRFVTNWVDVHMGGTMASEFWIPTFAAIPTGDRWVDPFSAGHSIPDEQTRRFPGSHTSVLKLPGIAQWVAERITHSISANKRGRIGPNRPVIVASFNSHTRADLFDTYQAAIDEFRQSGRRSWVLDMTDTAGAHPASDEAKRSVARLRGRPDDGVTDDDHLQLHVRVVPTEVAGDALTRGELQVLREALDRRVLTALGLSPFGPDAANWETLFRDTVGPGPTRWVAAAPDVTALRREIINCLDRAHRLVDNIGIARTTSTFGLD